MDAPRTQHQDCPIGTQMPTSSAPAPSPPVDVTHDLFVAPTSLSVDNLTLRSWQPGDGATMARVTNASYEHLAPWMDWAAQDDDAAAAEVRVRDFAGQYLSRSDFILSIWLDGELAGGSGLHPRWGGREKGIAEVGMWIASQHANKGLGTRVLTTLVEWAFSDAWGWRQLLWLCDPTNTASARTAEKAKFRREAVIRGGLGRHPEAETTVVYGLMATDQR